MIKTLKVNNVKEKHLYIAILFILVFGFYTIYGLKSFEIDVEATVYKVIDGDTFDAFPVGRVRLADVNAPELYEAGGMEAKQALASLILGKKVYLDIDDIYVMDKHLRLVGVVYVRVDSKRLMNVNKFLLDNKYVSLADYDNEFNPSDWALYEHYPESTYGNITTTVTVWLTRFQTVTATQPESKELVSVGNTILFMIFVVLIIILVSMLRRRRRPTS